MAETASQPPLSEYSKGKDYAQYTVEGTDWKTHLRTLDPANTRGGEINGEPYVQPSLFMHILKSLKPGELILLPYTPRTGPHARVDPRVLLVSAFAAGASW